MDCKIPDVILFGNGLSMAVGRSDKWKEIIEKYLKNTEKYQYEDIKDIPANMQIVVATDNHVDSCLDELRNNYYSAINEEQSKLFENLLSVDADAFLTTNYDYDVEQSAGIKATKHEFQKCRKYTKEVGRNTLEKKSNLYQYSSVTVNKKEKQVWHIHGDICLKDSMVMGHAYYARQLTVIRRQLSTFFREINAEKKGISYKFKSWVDYFLAGNIYIFGFGFYFTETDLWYLLDEKKRSFPETKVYFYSPNGRLEKSTEILMKTYDVNIIKDIEFNGVYKDYYNAVICDIKLKMENNK